MSSEPAEMARFIAVIRDLETALGSARRMMTPAEVERRNANRRSIHLRRAMAAGDTLAFEELDFRRPGYGMAPTETDRHGGKHLASAQPAGGRLDGADLASGGHKR